MNCDQVGAFTLLCVDAAEDGKSIVETWSVFPEKQKLVHPKSINQWFGHIQPRKLVRRRNNWAL
jgi:hypothetical protein